MPNDEPARLGARRLHLEETHSTNDVVKQHALQGEPEGLVVTAEVQTEGRGRRGRVWVGHKGKSLMMSVLLRPPWSDSQANWVGVLGGLAAAECLHEAGVQSIGIKWPNDVLVNGRKIAGVLVEPRLNKDSIEFVVLGIGINVEQLCDDWTGQLCQTATSCRMEGVKITRNEMAERFITVLNRLYDHMLRVGPEQLLQRWSTWSGSTSLPVLT